MSGHDEEGVTLVELMITMVILSIVSLMLFTFMQGITTVTARTDRNVKAEQEAQLVLRKITEEVRAADPIVDAAGCTGGFGDCLRFDVPRVINFAQPCVRRTIAYKLDRVAGRITRDATEWTWNSATSACVASSVVTGRVMIESLVFPASVPLFAYTDQSGGAVATANIPAPPSANGTAAVRVNLRIRYQKQNAPDLVLSSNAVLRNNR